MIQRSSNAVETEVELHIKEVWQTLLSQSQITTRTLLSELNLLDHPLADETTEALFKLSVPQPYIDKMAKGDPNDPLLLQVLPQRKEHDNPEGFVFEPLQEKEFSPRAGLIHKYKSRVLLITTQACAINCRYCFRRNFPYNDHQQSRESWKDAIAYIAKLPEVNEVILSGGDPLTLGDKQLSWLLNALDELPNIKRIRIHTRLIPSLPQRITKNLISVLQQVRSKLIIVSHCNHPNELAEDTALALDRLKQVNVTLFNQSVLLKGVNDSADILTELSEKLWHQGVLPYYLFTLDKVSGASHFDIDHKHAMSLHKELMANLPGFLVPRLAVEVPGESSKTLLT